MSKKQSVSENIKKSTTVLHEITGDEPNIQNDSNISNASNDSNVPNDSSDSNVSRETNVHKAPGRPKVYDGIRRISINIDSDTYDYLKAAAYRESSPTHLTNVTEYINGLIKADREKHEGDSDAEK